MNTVLLTRKYLFLANNPRGTVEIANPGLSELAPFLGLFVLQGSFGTIESVRVWDY